MGLSIVGHLKQEMKEVIVDAHIGLLVVDLMNFDGDIGLGNRQFHLLPHLKCSIQLQPNPHHKTALHFIESIPVADDLRALWLSGFQGKGADSFEVAELNLEYWLLLNVACVYQYFPPFLPFGDYISCLLFVQSVQEVLFVVCGNEVALMGLQIAFIEEGWTSFYKFQVPDVGQSLVVLDFCDGGKA